jgi:hypothetical protein
MVRATKQSVRDLDTDLTALSSYERALVPLPIALRRLGLRGESGRDYLADLEVGGWLQTYVDGPVIQVILSAKAADRLGLELVSHDESDPLSCRWMTVTSRFKPQAGGTETPLTDVGDGQSGWYFANQVKATDIGEPGQYWHARLVLGTGRTEWSPALECPPDPGAECGVCRGQLPNGADALCLACLRTSPDIERRIRKVIPKLPRKRRGLACLPQAVTNGGTGRTVKKAVKASRWTVKAVKRPGFKMPVRVRRRAG